MVGKVLQTPDYRPLSTAGAVMAAAKLYVYLTGGTTPSASYTTSGMTVANANPVIADAAGMFPPIFLDPAVTYRLVLKTSASVQIDDLDPVTVAANIAAASVTGAMLTSTAVADSLAYTPANVATSLQTGRHTMVIPAGGFTPRTTGGCAALATTELASNKINFPSLDFDTTTTEYAQIGFPVPKSVTITSFTYRIRWTAASGSGGVAWTVAAVGFSDDDAMDAAMGTGITVTDTLLSANDQHVTAESATVTVGGSPSAQDWIHIELNRAPSNGSDTLAVDAKFLAIELFLTVAATTDT